MADVKSIDAAIKRAPRIDGEQGDTDGTRGKDLPEHLKGRYVYITGMDRWYDTHTATLLAKSAVDISHRSELGRSAGYSLLEAGFVEIVQAPTWVPNGPRFIDRGSARYLNVYEPQNEAPVEGDVTLFLELAEYIVPDADVREHFLDWFAFAIQQPERKPNWQILLGGIEGIGKDALIYPIKRAVGFHNVVTIGPHDLESQFNDQLAHKKLGILNEMLAFRNPRLENTLKQYAADPPDQLQINPKGASRYTVPNTIALIGMTNHRSQGMTLSKNDRRWTAFWSPAKPLPSSYYDELWNYLEGDGGLHVWYWLAHRDLARFNPKSRAPDTDYKRELIEVSEDPHLVVLRDRIEDRGWPFDADLVVMDQVLRFLDNPRLDAGKVGGLLRELGCEDRRAALKVDGRTKTLRVWIVRRHEHFKALRAAELYQQADAAAQPRMTSGNRDMGEGGDYA